MMTREQKTKILEAFLDKAINKEEMTFLLDNGLHIPIIEWIPAGHKAKEEASQKRRELIERVRGVKFPKITWVKT